MPYPQYRMEGRIDCWTGDFDGYGWVKEIYGIDDDDAAEEYRRLEEEYRLKDRKQLDRGGIPFVTHNFYKLVRIDTKEQKVEIKPYNFSECSSCKGQGRCWVTDGVVQGQDYGPQENGHWKICTVCNGSKKVYEQKPVS